MVNRSIVQGYSSTTQVKKVVVGKPVRRVSAGQFLLSNLGDVSATGATTGDMLVYQSSTGKWTAQKEIEDGQNINGGSY